MYVWELARDTRNRLKRRRYESNAEHELRAEALSTDKTLFFLFSLSHLRVFLDILFLYLVAPLLSDFFFALIFSYSQKKKKHLISALFHTLNIWKLLAREWTLTLWQRGAKYVLEREGDHY